MVERQAPADLLFLLETEPLDDDMRSEQSCETWSAWSDGTVSEDSEDEFDKSEREVLALFPPRETLLIFDWDDTLFPSTWVQLQGFAPPGNNSPQVVHLDLLDAAATSAAAVLRTAKRLGRVVVVTNAEAGWVELSGRRFVPKVMRELEGVSVVSARSTFEPYLLGPPTGGSRPFEWKRLAFQAEIAGLVRQLAPGRRANVVSLGDSAYERDALQHAAAAVPGCQRKSVKFLVRPDPHQLVKQLALVRTVLEPIVEHDGDLDLRLRFDETMSCVYQGACPT